MEIRIWLKANGYVTAKTRAAQLKRGVPLTLMRTWISACFTASKGILMNGSPFTKYAPLWNVPSAILIEKLISVNNFTKKQFRQFKEKLNAEFGKDFFRDIVEKS